MRGPVRITQPNPARLSRSQRSFSPLTNHLPLMLSNRRQQVQRQPVRMRHIAGHELDAAIHQVSGERHVAGQSVKLGNDQRCAVKPTGSKRRRKLRTIGFTARLNLQQLGDYRVTARGGKPLNGSALCLQP